MESSSCLLTSLSVDEILLPGYLFWSANIRGLPLKVELAPSFLNHNNSVLCAFTYRPMLLAASFRLCCRESAWADVLVGSARILTRCGSVIVPAGYRLLLVVFMNPTFRIYFVIVETFSVDFLSSLTSSFYSRLVNSNKHLPSAAHSSLHLQLKMINCNAVIKTLVKLRVDHNYLSISNFFTSVVTEVFSQKFEWC